MLAAFNLHGVGIDLEVKLAPSFLFATPAGVFVVVLLASLNWQESRTLVGCCVLDWLASLNWRDSRTVVDRCVPRLCVELILNLNLSSHQCLFFSPLDSVFTARRCQESRTVVGCCVPGFRVELISNLNSSSHQCLFFSPLDSDFT